MKRITFGRFLVVSRGKLNLTASEAARRCGVSRSHWSHYEHDRKWPDEHVLYAMSLLFDVPMGRLYEYAHPDTASIRRALIAEF